MSRDTVPWPDRCSVCGRTFTRVVRSKAVTHPSLFGGIDFICRQCWKNSMKDIGIDGPVKHALR